MFRACNAVLMGCQGQADHVWLLFGIIYYFLECTEQEVALLIVCYRRPVS
jgi:hypothetical protein